MTVGGLTRETIQGISGNLVPLAILVFFAGWYALEAPWGWDGFTALVFYGLVGHLALALFVVTYVFALRIQDAEERTEDATEP